MLLVTGATGHIGRELTRELDAKGARFRVLVRDPARAAALPERAERVTGDLGQPATLAPPSTAPTGCSCSCRAPAPTTPPTPSPPPRPPALPHRHLS